MEYRPPGFKRIIVPVSDKIDKTQFKNIEVIQVSRLLDAITACVSKTID